MLISTTKLAQIKGVTTQTIRRWIKAGLFETVRTPGGHFRINYLEEQTTILYARVSSKKQLTSIDKQKELLEAKYNGKFLYDIGSGFNFKRRNFVKILEQVLSGTPIKLVVTAPDRISRSGLTFIIKVIEFYGGEVIFLEDYNQTESFDISTLIAFLTSFCNPQSDKRNSKCYTKDKDIPQE